MSVSGRSPRTASGRYEPTEGGTVRERLRPATTEQLTAPDEFLYSGQLCKIPDVVQWVQVNSNNSGLAITGYMAMKLKSLRVAFGFTLGALLAFGAFASDADEASIREVQNQQAAAWNTHDAIAYANLFSEDGDVVNVLGWWWRGRPEIRSKLTDAFAWVFRDSKLEITDVQTRFIDQSTAVAHIRWTLDGAKVPPGAPAPPREGIQIQLLRKVGGQWLITSFQNTNSVPESPFPKGPPSAPTNPGR